MCALKIREGKYMLDTSFAQQLLMSDAVRDSQIMKSAFSTISKVSNAQKNKANNLKNLTTANNFGKLAYAVEGDAKYKKELDTNNDRIVTYNEYVKHITESRLSQYNLTENGKKSVVYSLEEDSQTGLLKFSITDMNKAQASYLSNYVQLPLSLIEQEA